MGRRTLVEKEAGAGRLPHFDQIQRAFGRHDVSGIEAHVGGAAADDAAKIGARAYASGTEIAFASPPDLHTAAHEAAHVVQQRRGVALPSGMDGGAGDPYEHHADEVADAVVRGESAEALLDGGPRGGGTTGDHSAAPIQRKPNPAPRVDQPKADAGTLPFGLDFRVLADGSVLVRNKAFLEASDKLTSQGGGIGSPSLMKQILEAERAAHLPWIDPADIPRLSQQIGLTAVDPKLEFQRYPLQSTLYLLIGPPPDADIIASRTGPGMSVIVRQRTIAPVVVTPDRVALSPELRDRILKTLERVTSLSVDPQFRNKILNGTIPWSVAVDPARKGVLISFTPPDLEQVFGKDAWTEFAKKPDTGVPTSVPKNPDGTDQQPQWLPKGSLELTPKRPQYVTKSQVSVALKWDLGVHPNAGEIMLPNHCEYEWVVTRFGKVVDHETSNAFDDNRSTKLTLDGAPGDYEVQVAATSEHFLTPDKKFRLHVTIPVVVEKVADAKAFDAVATGADGPFTRGADGKLHVKPHEKALTVDQELQSIAMTEGAVDALYKKGDLTRTDHDVLYGQLEQQRKALAEVAEKTKSGTPYVVRGTFLSREDSTSTPLKVLMHVMERSYAGDQGEYKVLLHDTTFGTVTQHPGEAKGPLGTNKDVGFAQLEGKALDEMADHVHAHNDFPSGTVHLAAQQLAGTGVWEGTRDTDNGRKTAKKVLSGVAMVGGALLMIVPGGGFVSAAVFAVTATAGAASVVLEIEDRVQKEGELKFDRRLALDVLQLVSTALPFGTMTRVLGNATRCVKAGFKLAMVGIDAAQGFLIVDDAIHQIELVEANAAFSLAQATTPEDKHKVMADRDQKIASIVGGAMIGTGFILVSVGGNIASALRTLRTGKTVSIRQPVIDLGKDPVKAREAHGRGWFEHTNAKGEVEKVALTEEELAHLDECATPAPAPAATQHVVTAANAEAVGAKIKASPKFKDPKNKLDKVIHDAKGGESGALGELEAVERWLAEGKSVEAVEEVQNQVGADGKPIKNPDYRVDGKFTEIKSRETGLNKRWIKDQISAANTQMKQSVEGDKTVGDVEIQLRGADASTATVDAVDEQIRGAFTPDRNSRLTRVSVYKDGVLFVEWVRGPDGKTFRRFPK